MYYTSECCGALALYEMHKYENIWYGLCGDCAEHTEFREINTPTEEEWLVSQVTREW
mgnify:CR=1 FL=1